MKNEKLTERLFWIVPIVVLIIINVWVYFIHGDLFFSILISSISILFTTLWLYVLLPLKERLKWQLVEKEIKKELVIELRALFDVTIGYFKGGVISLSYEVKEGLDEEKIWENARLEKFKEFSNKKELEISNVGKAFLKAGNPAVYVRYRKDISNIENKYFKFMKPLEILSLIKIQKLLTYLINITNSTKVKVFKFSEEHYEKNLCKYSLELYKEIFHFHKNFINLFNK